MIDIFICEDNPKQLNLFKKFISNFILMEGFDMQIVQVPLIRTSFSKRF